ncbi:MAG: hypothetical protein HY303_06550, partial [Candidatus Wallbacteria bacterium]|nr:hypothetical protein [Candidatus Wallbacteria bacterium]
MSVCRKLAAIVPATLMTLSVAMASSEIGLTSASAPSLQWSPSKKGEIKLKPVMEQAQDMHFSNTMLV